MDIAFVGDSAANIDCGAQLSGDGDPRPRGQDRRPNGHPSRSDTERAERETGTSVNDGVPNGIRTRVTNVRGWSPRPLDDGDMPVAPVLAGASFKRANS